MEKQFLTSRHGQVACQGVSLASGKQFHIDTHHLICSMSCCLSSRDQPCRVASQSTVGETRVGGARLPTDAERLRVCRGSQRPRSDFGVLFSTHLNIPYRGRGK